MAQAGASGTPSSGTSGAPSAAGRGTDAGWGAKLRGAIRANTTYQIPADMAGNPKAEFEVRLMPDCSLASVKLRKSSGVRAWDLAAERAIQRTDPFPRDREGRCPETRLTITHGPRDE